MCCVSSFLKVEDHVTIIGMSISSDLTHYSTPFSFFPTTIALSENGSLLFIVVCGGCSLCVCVLALFPFPPISMYIVALALAGPA